MSKLNYKTKSDGQLIQKSKYYNVKSFYKDSELMDMFLRLKANVCDLNPALVTKCITGTEQDFILLMNRAKDFIESMFPKTGLEEKKNSVRDVSGMCLWLLCTYSADCS